MTEQRWVVEVAEALLASGEELGARGGHMFGYPALYVGRRLVACAYGDGIGVKLPADRVEMLIAGGQATHFQPYGKAAMRRWAHLPADSADRVAELRPLLAEAASHGRTAGAAPQR